MFPSFRRAEGKVRKWLACKHTVTVRKGSCFMIIKSHLLRNQTDDESQTHLILKKWKKERKAQWLTCYPVPTEVGQRQGLMKTRSYKGDRSIVAKQSSPSTYFQHPQTLVDVFKKLHLMFIIVKWWLNYLSIMQASFELQISYTCLGCFMMLLFY